MKLENIKYLSISDIIEFAPIMKLSIKESKPEISKYAEKHNVRHQDVKDICRVVVALGLYK